MRFSSSSPTNTQSLLGGDSGRGSPRSHRFSLRTSVHAVTIACTGAFAAISTALVFVFLLAGRQSDNERRSIPPLRYKGGLAKKSAVADVENAALVKLANRRSLVPPRIAHPDGGGTPDSSKWPRGVVWLMSFPNSGTSYTLHTVRELTNTTTATNYGLEGDIKDEESVPVFKGDVGMDGPFLELIRGRTTNLPELILTKTHCGGYSYSRQPENYIVTPRKFLRECLFSQRGVRSEDNSMEKQSVWYKPDLVKKVVHITRDPFDNVVARFHLDRYGKEDSWLEEYPANKLGFQKWCKVLDDDNMMLMKNKFVDKDLKNALTSIPCRAEFFRYVQWHNMVSSSMSSARRGVNVFVVWSRLTPTSFPNSILGIHRNRRPWAARAGLQVRIVHDQLR